MIINKELEFICRRVRSETNDIKEGICKYHGYTDRKTPIVHFEIDSLSRDGQGRITSLLHNEESRNEKNELISTTISRHAFSNITISIDRIFVLLENYDMDEKSIFLVLRDFLRYVLSHELTHYLQINEGMFDITLDNLSNLSQEEVNKLIDDTISPDKTENVVELTCIEATNLFIADYYKDSIFMKYIISINESNRLFINKEIDEMTQKILLFNIFSEMKKEILKLKEWEMK